MNFKKLHVSHFMAIRYVSDYENYLDALVLIDDLLCLYDISPRCPGYFAKGDIEQAIHSGTLTQLNDPIKECIMAIYDEMLRNNIKDNFELALQLYEERESTSNGIGGFLNGLTEQYMDVVHPAVAPD